MSSSLLLEKDVMDILSLSKDSTRKLFNTSGFPSFFIGRKGYITEDKFIEFIENMTEKKFIINRKGFKL